MEQEPKIESKLSLKLQEVHNYIEQLIRENNAQISVGRVTEEQTQNKELKYLKTLVEQSQELTK
ncbi:MAG: hypothetical protein HYX22_03200 [Candidatus Yanofskybacteria bacterium]|nr:hypothetical protein [Candidatus Yanofskybacteria bacterium]